MNGGEEIWSLGLIQRSRTVLRKAAGKCMECGATQEHVTIGAFLAALDLAEDHAGPGIVALEWLRNLADVLEKTIFAQAASKD